MIYHEHISKDLFNINVFPSSNSLHVFGADLAPLEPDFEPKINGLGFLVGFPVGESVGFTVPSGTG